MKEIVYKFNDGEVKKLLVDDKAAERHEALNREEENANRRYRAHNISLEALPYVGTYFESHDETPVEWVNHKEEEARAIAFIETLTPTQRRRLGYLWDEKTEREIAKIEKVCLKSVQETRSQLQKKYCEFFDYHPVKKEGKHNG